MRTRAVRTWWWSPTDRTGPRHQVKEGVVQLARATGRPVVAIGIAAEPSRRLSSWDRAMLVYPFGRVRLVLGAPIPIARGEAARAVAAVQAALDATAAEAASRVARSHA